MTSEEKKLWKLYDEWLELWVKIGKGYESAFKMLCEQAPSIPKSEVTEWDGATVAVTGDKGEDHAG